MSTIEDMAEGPHLSIEMVDGEHRTRILADLGATTVPAVVVEGVEEDEARIRLLSMNKLRGQFVPIRLAYLLRDLASRIDEKELRRRLGFDAAEFRDTLRLTEFTEPFADTLRTAVQRESKEAPVVVKFVCSARDAAAIDRVVDKLVEGKVDRGQALAKICRKFEQLGKSDKE
jgi:hypothetical protein